jgi:mono/diheme cytochrome c family protein
MKTKNIQTLAPISVAVFVLAAWGGDVEHRSLSIVEPVTMQQELPDGVTSAMVEEGKDIYSGAGICMSCHGPNGEGVPNLGNDLTDEEWLHIDGSYESIVRSILNGVTAEESSTGAAMPAKGGTRITDEQVRAVAAYVWTLSH